LKAEITEQAFDHDWDFVHDKLYKSIRDDEKEKKTLK